MAGSWPTANSDSVKRLSEFRTITMTWLGDSGTGAVPDRDFTDSELDFCQGFYLYMVKTVPGDPAPAAYTLTIEDADGYDWLKGAGATRSTTAAEVIQPAAIPVDEVLTIKIASQTEVSARGTVKLYFAR